MCHIYLMLKLNKNQRNSCVAGTGRLI